MNYVAGFSFSFNKSLTIFIRVELDELKRLRPEMLNSLSLYNLTCESERYSVG